MLSLTFLTFSQKYLIFFCSTFSQKWIKENVTWHGNGTMSYQTRKEFKFVPELSSGNQETDIITTANVPAISAFYQMRKSGYFYRVTIFSNCQPKINNFLAYFILLLHSILENFTTWKFLSILEIFDSQDFFYIFSSI